MSRFSLSRRGWMKSAGACGLVFATGADRNRSFGAHEKPHTVDIGSRRELFVDEELIEKLGDVQLVMHRPRDEGQVLAFDKPWEGGFCAYATVIRDNDQLRLYYRHRGGESPIEHLYTNQTHPYFRAPHLYVSIAARFMPGRQVLSEDQAKAINVNPRYFKDTSDAILMTSRPGRDVYDRTFLSSFVRPGIGAHNWVSRTNYPALNVVQTGPAEMSVYLNQDYAQPTAHLRRYSMRLDGFASAQADYNGGELVTKPLSFSGQQLKLNFATSAAGGIRVEIQDTSGKPIPGFTISEAREQIGNEIERVVSWEAGTDISRLAGQDVRLRFAMHGADLYAFQFSKGVSE